MAKPSALHLNNFLTGHALNFGGGEFGGGAFVQVSPSLVGTSSTAAATVVGAATPQIGGGYSYSWDIMSLGVSW
jgi:hypothetical protein